MYISVDVGGTNIRVASSTSLSEINFSFNVRRSLTSKNFEQDITFIAQAAIELANGDKIKALGINLPGTLSEDKAELTFANNLKHWEFQPFAKQLNDKLGCSIYAEHDGVAAGIGEAYYGDVPPEFTYVIWGTGIGGAYISKQDDTITEAYEIIWKDYFIPWEESCGGRAISERYKTSPADLDDDSRQTIYHGFEKHLDIFIKRTGSEYIVFAGALSFSNSDFINNLGDKHGVTTQVSKLGENSGLYGGFGLIHKNLAL